MALIIFILAGGLLLWKGGKLKKQDDGNPRMAFAGQFLDAARGVDMKGIPVNMAMSVAALETGWGTGRIFAASKNLFNIKAAGAWKGDYYAVTTSEGAVKFRKYNSWAESIKDFVGLITGLERYHPAYVAAIANNYKGFFSGIQSAGYAGGDTAYAAKLISTLSAVNTLV